MTHYNLTTIILHMPNTIHTIVLYMYLIDIENIQFQVNFGKSTCHIATGDARTTTVGLKSQKTRQNIQMN